MDNLLDMDIDFSKINDINDNIGLMFDKTLGKIDDIEDIEPKYKIVEKLNINDINNITNENTIIRNTLNQLYDNLNTNFKKVEQIDNLESEETLGSIKLDDIDSIDIKKTLNNNENLDIKFRDDVVNSNINNESLYKFDDFIEKNNNYIEQFNTINTNIDTIGKIKNRYVDIDNKTSVLQNEKYDEFENKNTIDNNEDGYNIDSLYISQIDNEKNYKYNNTNNININDINSNDIDIYMDNHIDVIDNTISDNQVDNSNIDINKTNSDKSSFIPSKTIDIDTENRFDNLSKYIFESDSYLNVIENIKNSNNNSSNSSNNVAYTQIKQIDEYITNILRRLSDSSNFSDIQPFDLDIDIGLVINNRNLSNNLYGILNSFIKDFIIQVLYNVSEYIQ